MREVTPKMIREAIDDWYTARYPFGVRLTIGQRQSLAQYIAQRVGATRPNPSAVTSDRGDQSGDESAP